MSDHNRSFFVMIWLLASLRFTLESTLKKCGESVYERGVLEVFDSVGSEGIVFLLFFLKGWESQVFYTRFFLTQDVYFSYSRC